MNQTTVIDARDSSLAQEATNSIEELLREGTRKMLQAAIENEVQDYTEAHRQQIDENGVSLFSQPSTLRLYGP
jgi:hypothetical protein